ncbi:hypothetical protein F9C07_2233816 [Aspergillus flavus]|uniref:Uncharacterized protein n=2 Tax=Aspergillus flavus TaxID=5059 RepID=A0A7U2MIE2_ASPFN|nr:hypothetical protein F9C07_2233816 [Aspergillus flavus]RMZ40926.1 hypothetical protein CA14_001347 [Aspergillus flavus]
MNLKSIAAALLTASVASAVQHQYTSLRTTSMEGHRIPALKSKQTVLGLGVATHAHRPVRMRCVVTDGSLSAAQMGSTVTVVKTDLLG